MSMLAKLKPAPAPALFFALVLLRLSPGTDLIWGGLLLPAHATAAQP
jgi:hypothetical protein